jgi:hypothetical protein
LEELGTANAPEVLATLRFYTDARNWEGPEPTPIAQDRGVIACEALMTVSAAAGGVNNVERAEITA